MAKLTLIIESNEVGFTANGGGITVARNINEASLTRLLDSYETVYVTAGVLQPAPTRNQVARKWFLNYVRAAKHLAKRIETSKAVKTARNSITDVV